MPKFFLYFSLCFIFLSFCLLSGCMNNENGTSISVSGSMEMQHTSGRTF